MSKSATPKNALEQARQVYSQAAECIKKQDFGNAEKYLTESLEIAPIADAAHNLGTLRFMQNKIDAAIELFQQAFTLDPHYDAAYANLMRIFYQKGDFAKAMEYSAMAMTAAPENTLHKEEFVKILSKIKIQQATPEIKQLVAFCLEDRNLSFDDLALSWLHLITVDQDIEQIYALRGRKDFEECFEDLEDYKGLLARYFTLGLCRLKIEDGEFQTFLNKLRTLILKDHIEENTVLFDKSFLELIAAVSVASRKMDFDFEESVQEKEWLEKLRCEVKEHNALKNPKALLILGCYEDIGTDPYAQTLKAVSESAPDLKKFLSSYPAQ